MDYRSTTIKQEDIKDLPSNPALENIPDELKSIKGFEELEKKLARIMFSDHKHSKVVSFEKCKRCGDKILKRRAELVKIGFKDYSQYLTYKKVMNLIQQNHEKIA